MEIKMTYEDNRQLIDLLLLAETVEQVEELHCLKAAKSTMNQGLLFGGVVLGL